MTSRAAHAGIDGMGMKAIEASNIDGIAERLRRLRVAVEMTPSDLCAEAKLSTSRWSNWENAKGRPDLAGAVKLVEAFGVTLDWIYFGDVGGLPDKLRSKIAAATSERARRGRPFAA